MIEVYQSQSTSLNMARKKERQKNIRFERQRQMTLIWNPPACGPTAFVVVKVAVGVRTLGGTVTGWRNE